MKQVSACQVATQPSESQIVSVHGDFTLEVCLSPESRQLAFQIRYRSYLQAGMIPVNEEGMLYDDYDFAPNVRIFLVWNAGKPVATIRSCVYSEAYNWLPTEGVHFFEKELTAKLGEKVPLLESNRFAIDPDFQGRHSIFAQFLLFRAHGLNSAFHQCEYIITSVQSNHIAFYQRFLGLNPISDTPRQYDWIDAEISLLINRSESCLGAILKRGMPEYNEEDVARFAEQAKLSLIDHQRKVA
ncbi:N-acyl amino acid synthase FeeM domain-containing protein [Flavilitoribacter nigricans]|uniref:N-acyl amino acid synthase FeeM catalytic core domain-containing protein n=1 Tax=Flavilitoribacter nigricans (strain ATCC 23147 / DSM 23189 / NBRC 102662 / NCIMB 1420 / SS-2) TaxID=1122177 RepID=A0A2D0NC91_FLAN2|nr:hypothetical protein [Flavilitoribacter nigricans]PHN05990.1 hypothetical protein CRP01_13545 [Flavilitoribacter nigricans DSM 23189 = NBRC 102662]